MSAPPPNPMTQSTDVDFLWKIHSYTNDYIRFADTKAAFTATLAAALIGILTSSQIFDGLLNQRFSAWPKAVWLGMAATGLLGLSILSAVFAVMPRLWRTQKPLGKGQLDVVSWSGHC